MKKFGDYDYDTYRRDDISDEVALLIFVLAAFVGGMICGAAILWAFHG